MDNGTTIATPMRYEDRLVTERARHIYDYADSRNLRSGQAPVGFCGRRIKTGEFVAGLHVRSYLQMARHPRFAAFRDKVLLTRDLCPACERLAPVERADIAA
ncbi:MAG: hypothetical protein OXI16_13845 [Chloroflexota bacterium]|nr:hypothetical protein [Chloroflexota bacterium]